MTPAECGPETTAQPASVQLDLQSRRPVGLLAGSGRFPLTFARKARSVGLPVVCVGLRTQADKELAGEVEHFYWTGVARLGRAIRLFRRHRVEQIVLAGKVQKADILLRPWRLLSLLPDWRTFRLIYLLPRADNKDDSLLLAVVRELERDGLQVASALDLCPELLVDAGVLTRRAPTRNEEADIAFGWQMAKEMGRLDVGQSVAVKERAVLAVEAIEGTDRAIARAGELCRAGGFVVVKVAKPQQDMRFDVPTVGCTTIETLARAGGRVLAIEAERTIVLDREETIALANRHGLTIVALRGS